MLPAIPTTVQTKACSICKCQKALDKFGSSGGGKYPQSYCKDCNKEKLVKYRENNSTRLAEYDAERRNRDQRSVFSDQDKTRFWKRAGGICLCCGQLIAVMEISSASVDHCNPLSKGGTNEDQNLALAHRSCNQKKHNKTLEKHWEYRYHRGEDEVTLTKTIIDERIKVALGGAGAATGDASLESAKPAERA